MLFDSDLTRSKVMCHLLFRKTWKDVIDTLAEMNLAQCHTFLEDELSHRFPKYTDWKAKCIWLGISQSEFTKAVTVVDEPNFITVAQELETGE